MNSRIGLSLLILTLSGCAAKSVGNDFAFQDEKQEGIALFSVSHDSSGGKHARAIFYLNGGITGTNGHVAFSLSDAVPGMPFTAQASQFRDSQGQLLALALPSGKHQFTSWQIMNGKGLSIHPRETPPALEFQVEAGKAVYLGNLHGNLQLGRNVFGMTIVGDGYPEVRDRRARDVELFEAKYPQFKGKVSVALLTLGPWWSGAETRRQVDMPPSAPLPARK